VTGAAGAPTPTSGQTPTPAGADQPHAAGQGTAPAGQAPTGPAPTGQAPATEQDAAFAGQTAAASVGQRGEAAGQATERSGISALASALRSMTSAHTIVPTARKPPSGRQLAVLSGWAALLGVIGLAIGLRGLVVILADKPPTWFEPSLIVCGLGGIALTACGFVTARRRPLPWVFLGAATAVLIVSVVVSASA
jgi:hypothetical protein